MNWGYLFQNNLYSLPHFTSTHPISFASLVMLMTPVALLYSRSCSYQIFQSWINSLTTSGAGWGEGRLFRWYLNWRLWIRERVGRMSGEGKRPGYRKEGIHVRSGRQGRTEGGEAEVWPVCLLLPTLPSVKVRASLLCSHCFWSKRDERQTK